MSDKKKVSKAAKRPITQGQIDELIRKLKGKNTVECDRLKSCMDPKIQPLPGRWIGRGSFAPER